MDSVHGFPDFHSGSLVLDTSEDVVRDRSGNHVICHCFFCCPTLGGCLVIYVASINVRLGDHCTGEVVAPEARLEQQPDHMIPIGDPVQSVHGKLSDSSTIIAHGSGDGGTRLSEVVIVNMLHSKEYSAQLEQYGYNFGTSHIALEACASDTL